MTQVSTAERVAGNIIERHGFATLERLVEHFRHSRRNQDIARELGVSRERVRQWRSQLGGTITGWWPDAFAVELASRRRLPPLEKKPRKSRAKVAQGETG